MKKMWTIVTMVALLLLAGAFAANDSQARAGGGQSFGSRSSRTYSSPSRSYSTPSPAPQQPSSPTQPPPTQPAGGFWRGMAGGVAGGLLGGMLFNALGGGGWGGGGGGGLMGILLIAGIGFLIFRFLRGRNQQQNEQWQQPSYDYSQPQASTPLYPSQADDRAAGLAAISQADPSFNESRFCDQVMDTFFKIQGAWMHRDLTPVAGLLTDEIRGILQEDVARLLRDKQINRLENIAVRTVEITEAWQEPGRDFLTARIYANLLDYTVNDATSQVVSGSTTDPVKFEEFWTFSRATGNNPWKLSAIQQGE